MLSPFTMLQRARAWFYRLRMKARGIQQVSDDYRVLKAGQPLTAEGWKVPSAAAWQHREFERLLGDVRAGRPRIDFQIAAEAIKATGHDNPRIIEVGCGSGYYSEALSLLLARRIRYVGIDFSPAMVSLARAKYNEGEFLAGDACHLPLRNECCDILFNGTSIMHIPNYREAIAESVRTSREWCIFHTVPLVARRETTIMHKLAYGQRVVEVVFNQTEFESMLTESGLVINRTFQSIPYDVSEILNEPSWTATFLCRKR